MRRRSFILGSFAAGLGAAISGLPFGSPSAWAAIEPADILADIKPTHPRVAGVDDWAAMRARIAGDPRTSAWYDGVKAKATTNLSAPLAPFGTFDGVRLDVDVVMERLFAWALVAAVSEDTAHAERLGRELVNVCQTWPNWGGQFLEVARMSMAVGTAYDWAQHMLTEQQRQLVVATLTERGLKAAIAEYSANGAWPYQVNNWNLVCNGGVGVAALAIAHEQPELAGRFLSMAFGSMPRAWAEFAPDGGYPEGLDYWTFTMYTTSIWLSSLVSAGKAGVDGLRDDRGLAGLAQAGEFPIHLTGPSLDWFNYYDADTPAGTKITYSFTILGSLFDNAVYTTWRRPRADRQPHSMDVVHHAAAQPDRTPFQASWPRDRLFAHPDLQLTANRSSWEHPRGLWFATKAGNNVVNHQNLDLGTFVLDAGGYRMAAELGKDDYNLPGYWDFAQNSARFMYYRMRTEGQNTMLFGQSADQGQYYRAKAPIARHESNADATFTTMDLSGTAPFATRWVRGLRLTDQRRTFEVADEFTLSEAKDSWWFMHTGARISISADGRVAVLRRGGEAVIVRLAGGAGCTFVSAPAKALWTTPIRRNDPNAAFSKLSIRMRGATTQAFTVRFTTALTFAEAEAALAGGDTGLVHEPIAGWALAPELPQLKKLMVGPNHLGSFRPDVFEYQVPVTTSTAPRVNATFEGGPEAITQAAGVPGRAVVEVGQKTGRVSRSTIDFVNDDLPTNPGMTVLASTDDGNLPENTLDGNLAPRWSAEGTQWIRYDFGKTVTLSQVKIAWFNGHLRKSRFLLQVSDGGPWRTVVPETWSSGTTSQPETFEFPAANLRYVRYIGYGNTVNLWNSVSEVQFPESPLTITVPATLSTVTLTAPASMAIGATATATQRAVLSDGATASGLVVEWYSTNPAVTTITAEGVIKAVAGGTTQIGVVVTSADRRMTWDVKELVVTAPQQPRFTATHDAFVRGGTYGGDTYNWATIELKGSSAPEFTRVGYVRFDLGNVDVSKVTKAELFLTGVVTDGTLNEADVSAYATGAAWTETTITWNNAPAAGALLGTAGLTKSRAEVTIDVTAGVKAASVGFCLKQTRADGKEANVTLQGRTTATPPTLRLTLG